MLIRLLLVLIVVAAVTAPAMANPIPFIAYGVTALLSALAPAGAGALTIFGISASTFATGLATTIVAGAAAAFSLFGGGGRGGSIDPGKAKTIFETGNSGRIRTVGRVRIGGLKVFGNTSEFNRYRLIAHSKGPIDGIEDHFLGGRSVVVEADGSVSSPPFKTDSAIYCYVFRKTGDGTETAWTELTSAFPSLWTSAHRVKGIAQSLVIYVSPGITTAKFLSLYQSGVPDYERIQRGELIYDPRTDTTAWSDNGVLVCLHIMLTFPDFDLADFDLDFIGDEADRADVLVGIRGGGTEKRSRAWGVWDEDGIERGELLRQVLLSTGCEVIARPNDKLGIRLIDDNRSGELTFDQKHIIDLTIRYGPEGVERPNRLRLKYYAPQRNYEMTEIDLVDDRTSSTPNPLAWAVAQDEIDRVGEKIMEISLPFCPSSSQAQRIARRMFATARADSGSLTMNMVGLACWGVKTITITPPDLDENLTLEIEPPSVDEESGTVQIPFVRRPTLSTWTPATDEALAPEVIQDLEFESTIAQPVAATASAVVTYPSAVKHSRFAFADAGSGVVVECNYRVITGELPSEWKSLTEYRAPGGTSHAYTTTDLSGLTVQFRHRIFNADEDGSPWSTVTSFFPAVNNTAPAVPSLVTVETPGSPATGDSTITAPTSIQVAYITFAWSGDGVVTPGSEDIACKPGEVFTRSVDLADPDETLSLTATFTAIAKSTNGTASSTITQTITIEPSGGP